MFLTLGKRLLAKTRWDISPAAASQQLICATSIYDIIYVIPKNKKQQEQRFFF